MPTIYEVMQHNYTHGIREKGVSTLLHPLRNQGDPEPYAYALQFHQTDVVVAYPDGSVKLDSGGFSTPHYAWSNKTKTVSPTTRERVSRYLPEGYRIDQQNWRWVVVLPSGQEVAFQDGMLLEPDKIVMPQDTGMLVAYEATEPFGLYSANQREDAMTPYLVLLTFTTEPGTYDASINERHYHLKAASPIEAAQAGWKKVLAEYQDRSIELDSIYSTYHNGMDN